MSLIIYNSDSYNVLDLPEGYRGMKTDYFQRFLTFYGIPIMAPETVDDFALQEARWTLEKMFDTTYHRIRDLCATNLFIAVIPEVQAGLFDFQLENARIILVGENNLTDREADTSILIHEVGHAVHYSLCQHETQYIETLYQSRPFWGKTDTYAHKDQFEYFAEGVTAYFNAGMPGEPVRTRHTLQTFDPVLYATIYAMFESNEWLWQPINERTVLSEHTLLDQLKSSPLDSIQRV